MIQRRSRRRNRRPPWWFMPTVVAGLGLAGALLSMAVLTVAE
ncbi:hypothetical protein [Sphingobium bisphenolivorans]|nr:hypothetical protein [Sphingobium bisphenolivorans]